MNILFKALNDSTRREILELLKKVISPRVKLPTSFISVNPVSRITSIY